MKNYRYANLLAILMILLSIFSSVVLKSSSLFAVPSTDIADSPTTSSMAESDFALEKIDNIEQGTVTEIATSAKITKATPVNTTPVKKSTPCSSYYGYITIGGKTICLASTNTTSGSLSYSNAYIFNSSSYNSYNQYIFGHNTSNIFGSLTNLPAGSTFSVATNGATTNYRISFKETVCDYSNPTHPCSNYSEPVLNMRDVITPSRRGANLAIMTCAGTPIGNGDATHRLVIYATKI